MPDPKKPFSVKFTVPSLAGDKPADGGGPFATFEEVTTAAVAHTPGAVIKPAVSQHNNSGLIVDSAGCTIGTWEKKF
jgi:hypothetical protein